MSFAKSMGKNLRNRYGQKRLNSAKRSTRDAIKTASKGAIQKTAETTGDLIGNKIADKITSFSKKFPTQLHSQELQIVEIRARKKDTYLQKKGNKLLIN